MKLLSKKTIYDNHDLLDQSILLVRRAKKIWICSILFKQSFTKQRKGKTLY